MDLNVFKKACCTSYGPELCHLDLRCGMVRMYIYLKWGEDEALVLTDSLSPALQKR